MRRDPLIIGGGPAGSAAAITLGLAGYRPVLIERSAEPTDKVCGDFLGADAIKHLRKLGVEPLALGGVPIHRIRLIHGERVAEAELPFSAVGLSRRSLDAALLVEAGRCGAVVRTGVTVRQLTHEAGEWTAHTGERIGLMAQTVFLATGKHDLRDLPRAYSDRGAIGMKMYFSPNSGSACVLEGAVELTLFPGGYAGMQLVEGGRLVLCVAIQPQAFRRYGSGWVGVISEIARRNRRFAAMLAGAQPLLARPLAVARVPYGYQARCAVANGLYRLGDQAAVIPSLTGDGIAIALHSGSSAAGTWVAGGDSAIYHRSLVKTLTPQMCLAGLIHHGCMSGSTQSAVIAGSRLFPSLLRHAARRTRIPDRC